MRGFLIAITVVGSAAGGDHHHQHDNHCEPLEDYGPLVKRPETRRCCIERLKDNCVWKEETRCIDVTDLQCEVKLFTDCKMKMEDVELNECQAVTAQKDLKNCTKTMMPKVHTKDVYECKDVTKQHCTTVWEIINGEKVWTGNNDCKDVTWEECKAVKKDVTFLVPVMVCKNESHDYMDYEQQARPDQARATECEVKAEQVCQPVTTEKCADIKYKVCTEEKMKDCTDYDVLVPHKKKLHLKWCLLDEAVKDFTEAVEAAEGGGPPEDPAEVDETSGDDLKDK